MARTLESTPVVQRIPFRDAIAALKCNEDRKTFSYAARFSGNGSAVALLLIKLF
jgi:hypothetical protein